MWGGVKMWKNKYLTSSDNCPTYHRTFRPTICHHTTVRHIVQHTIRLWGYRPTYRPTIKHAHVWQVLNDGKLLTHIWQLRECPPFNLLAANSTNRRWMELYIPFKFAQIANHWVSLSIVLLHLSFITCIVYKTGETNRCFYDERFLVAFNYINWWTAPAYNIFV